ncbi:MAG: binary toxin-like calcium binding domain-containing protein [Euryarchaeota archaeon]|nr:binary toxin-like calcium binding domain-containing protein [Euryarchaeota archaeon]
MRKLIHVFVLLLIILSPGVALILAPVSGLDPLKTDTDGDGIPDGWEDEHGLNPNDATDASFDYNHNGLTNFQEYENDNSDPWDMDSDDDGISNYAECFGLFGFFTDPFASDTDEDGLSDLEEICTYINTGDETQMKEIYPDKTDRASVREDIISLRGVYPYKLDPTTNSDSDGDGLRDVDEISKGTNLNHVDSDYDGLSDGDEVHEYETDPTKRDTDGDGLLDSEEVFGTYGVVTDPTKVDTDGDGISDGEEILGFGFVPIEPSEHALTYEEFISGAYGCEYITLKAKVEKMRYHPDLKSYLVFLKPLESVDGGGGERGVAIVNSSWRYDFYLGEMMHVDSRFNFNLRERDTIVVVGKAGKFRGSTREIAVDSGGKMYLILSPEEAKERWLPSKDYIKIISDSKTQASAQTTNSTTAVNSSSTLNRTSTPTPLPSPVNTMNGTNETNATNATAAEVESKGRGIFGLLGYVAIGIVIIVAALFLYTKFGKRIQIRKGQKEGEGDSPPVEMSSMPSGTKKEWG